MQLRRALPLVVLALAACGRGGTGGSSGPVTTGTRSLPSELVGVWHYQNAGSPVCDDTTGQCTSSYSRSETLTLRADGTFEYALFAESNFPGCSLTAHHDSQGAADADGHTLELHISQGLTRTQDTCGESGDTNEAGKTYVYTYGVEQHDGTRGLTLTDDQGNAVGPYEPDE